MPPLVRSLVSFFHHNVFQKTTFPSGTHGLKLLVRVEAGLSSGCEVAENPEGVPWAALVGVNPIFPCRRVMGAGDQGRNPTAPPPAEGAAGSHHPAGPGGCGVVRCTRGQGAGQCREGAAAAPARSSTM